MWQLGGRGQDRLFSECRCLTSLQVVSLADYDRVAEVTKAGAKKSPSPGYPLVCVTPCDPRFPQFSVTEQRCAEAGINQSAIQFSWEVATPTDGSGARSPFETITDNTPFTSVNHKVCGSWVWLRGRLLSFRSHFGRDTAEGRAVPPGARFAARVAPELPVPGPALSCPTHRVTLSLRGFFPGAPTHAVPAILQHPGVFLGCAHSCMSLKHF